MWSLGLLLLLFGGCAADIFTAIADMQRMLGVEKEVTSVIESYIEAEQRRLDELKRWFSSSEFLLSFLRCYIGRKYVQTKTWEM